MKGKMKKGNAPAPPKKDFGSATKYADYAKTNPRVGGKGKKT